jgi:hypothetical protein
MKNFLPILSFALPVILNSCGGDGYGRIGLHDAPKIVNVSSYDPKEKQRSGEAFSPHDVSALRRNGARGLIARCGKGKALDDKCASFLRAAEREGLMLGTYYFVLKDTDPVWQADQYISRLRQIAPGRKVLLVGDFDTKSSPADLVKFIDRVEALTDVRGLSGKQRPSPRLSPQRDTRAETPDFTMPVLDRALLACLRLPHAGRPDGSLRHLG